MKELTDEQLTQGIQRKYRGLVREGTVEMLIMWYREDPSGASSRFPALSWIGEEVTPMSDDERQASKQKEQKNA